jgi:NADPH:quinone reductase
MTYKSIFITKKGGPEVLEMVSRDIPEPATGQARVRILYCGVGFTDVIMRLGYYPYAPKMPFAPGYEIIGIIDALGPGVQGFEIGQKVVALTVTGGYAEYIVLSADDLIPAPEGVDDRDAVAAILNYVTGYQMLHRVAQVHAGQSVLYTGASGGVGTALLQLGRAAGLTMYGTASKEKFALVTDNGGIPIDYRTQDVAATVREATGGNGVDASFDGIGGSFVSICKKALAKGGMLVSYGLTSSVKNGKADNMSVMKGFMMFGLLKLVMGKRSAFYGVTKLYRETKVPFKEDLPKIYALLRDKQIAPVIADVLPLSEARRANEMLERGGVHGKLLLKCTE